jgi:hypothetical protein
MAPAGAPAPAATAGAPAPAPAARHEPEKKHLSEEESKAYWLSDELAQMMLDYFTRYDLDGSGTINSNDELKQLCTNLVVKLELDMDVKTIDTHVQEAGDMTTKNWKFDEFQKWFVETFKPLPSWQPNDVSSSDEDANGGVPRSGTYDLVMNGLEPVAFKLRYESGDTSKLFKRVSNDDNLGYKKGGKLGKEDVPAGLHTITGTFDHGAKTCKFTKSYDVDYDASTKEPVFEFEGKIDSCTEISGTWKNTEDASIESVKDILTKLKLEAGSGSFTLKKRPKTD